MPCPEASAAEESCSCTCRRTDQPEFCPFVQDLKKAKKEQREEERAYLKSRGGSEARGSGGGGGGGGEQPAREKLPGKKKSSRSRVPLTDQSHLHNSDDDLRQEEPADVLVIDGSDYVS